MTAVPFRSAITAHPRTGEILTPDGINERILQITDALEESTPRLTSLIQELARVHDLYELTYDEAITASDASSKEKREAEARQACRVARTPLGQPLAERRIRLEAEIRALREEQHNLRSILSGWQTASKNIQAAMGGYGSAS